MRWVNMYLHPDDVRLMAHQRLTGYDKHSALHRAEAEAALRASRREAWERRRFCLRYRLSNLMFRLAPGLARRWAI